MRILVQSLLTVLLAIAPLLMKAQPYPNLITNGEFNSTLPSNQTQYIIMPSGNVEEGEFCIDNKTNGHNNLGLGWPNINGCSGKFLMANGWGYSTNPTKYIWKQEGITVAPNVNYQFSCKLLSILNSYQQYVGYPCKLQLKINGVQVATFEPTTHRTWLDWTYTWNSGSNTTAKIEIFDIYTGDPGMGDDFGIDMLSFKMDDAYSVTANDVNLSMCKCNTDALEINLPTYYSCTGPTQQNTLPEIAIKIGNNQWINQRNVPISTPHGVVVINNNNTLTYTPSSTFCGNDYFWYKVTKYGIAVQKPVVISIADVPSIVSITGFPSDNNLCLSDVGTFNPSATWNANGATISNPHWEICKPETGVWHPASWFNATTAEVRDYHVRFVATNSCSSSCTGDDPEVFLLHVCAPPVLTSNSITTPPTLCGANSTLPSDYLQQVSVYSWKNNEGTARWEVSHDNGQFWDPLTDATLNNNDLIRFRAFNLCGDAYTISKAIVISDGPEFTQNTPNFPGPYCSGETLNLPAAPAFNPNGITPDQQYWAYSDDGGNTYVRITGNSIVLDEEWDGRLICYILEFSCGGTPSTATSSPQRELTVYGAPEFIGDLPEIGHSFCVGESLTANDLQAPQYAGSPNVTTYWEISSGTSPSGYSPLTLPKLLSAGDNDKWIRYHAQGCGDATTNAIQIQVYDAPTVSIPNVPTPICAGGSFELTAPNIQNYGNVPTGQGWLISPTQNGTYTDFENSEIPYEYNQYWIKYFADNECSTGYSQPIQITVNDLPVVGDISDPPAICAGQSFTLNNPSVEWRHVNQGVGTWEIADPTVSDFQPLTNSNIPSLYNGYLLRYKAENGCGTTYSNMVSLTVYPTDPVYEDTIVACDVMEHHGVTCNNSGNYSATIQSPEGCDIIAYWYFELGDAYQAPLVRDTACNSFYWPRTQRTYYQSGSYDTTVISTNPLVCDSVFTLSVVINHAPEITNAVQQSQVQPICEHQNLNFPDPTVVWNYIGDELYGGYWMAAPTASGTYEMFSLEDVTYEYDQWWVKFVAFNDCGNDESDPVQISVRRAPVIVTEVPEMDAVCAGETLPLPDMDVSWFSDPGTEGWCLRSPDGNVIGITENTPMQYAYSGWTLYYLASNDCGEYSSNERTVTVNNKPSVAEIPPIQGICAGSAFDLPEVPVEWFGDQGTEAWQIAASPSESFTDLVNQDIPFEYNNWWLRYKATNGCGSDTSRMVQIQVYSTDPLEETLQACNPIDIYGFHCDHDDDYEKDSITEFGCHVIFTLHFSLGEQFEYPTMYANACDSYYWEKFHKWFDESAYFDTLILGGSPEVCDTLYSIQVEISHPNPISITTEHRCTDYFWEANGQTYYQSTVDTAYIPNGACFDTLVLRLTIAPLEDDTTLVRCKEYFWPLGGMTVGVGETADTVMFDPVTGCNVHYRLTVAPGQDITGVSDTVVTCDPYLWHDEWYDHSGVFSYDTEDPESGCTIRDMLYLTVTGFSDFDIHGETTAAVANSYWPGVYLYTIEVETEEYIQWTLLDVSWPYEPMGKTCLVTVSDLGTGRLVARLGDGGCNSDTIYINASQFGVEQLVEIPTSIYPNPASHEVTVVADHLNQVTLYNMLGQQVRSYSCQGDDSLTFDASSLPVALYIVEIRTDHGMARKPLSIAR